MVGLLAAQIDPTLFARVVLVGASPRYLNDGAYVGGFEQADLDALYAAMAGDYYAWASGFAPVAMGNPDNPDLAHEFQQTLSSMRPDVALQIARAIFQSDHRADLPSLKLPALILQSKSDIAVPVAVGETMHRQIAGSSYQLLDATGHFPHMSAPEQVTQAIRKFLQ
jgi:sigma-B regulation protein RsbQ